MAGVEKVESYQRTLASGRTITVASHQRVNEEAATDALAMQGRPPLAAKRGQFPSGRSLPGIWAGPPPEVKSKKKPAKTPAKTPAKSPKSLKDSDKPSKTERVVQLAREVRVSSYKRRNSSGELVDVRSYSRSGQAESPSDLLAGTEFHSTETQEKEKVARGEGFFLIKGPRQKLELKTPDGELIGSITWRKGDSYDEEPGEVLWLHVEPEWRRKGVATKLWNRARQIDSQVKHSLTQTDQGASWAKAVG